MNDPRHHVGNMDAGTLALLKDVAEATSEKTVRAFATTMGLPEDPIESQEMFAALRKLANRPDDPEAVADAAWARRWRPRTEGLFGKCAAAVLTLCTLGAGSTLVAGARALLAKGP